MSTFVKGNAIANAKKYWLYKKDNDNYSLVAAHYCGLHTDAFMFNAYIGSGGKFYEGGGSICTDFIHVDSLANDSDTNVCARLYSDADVPSKPIVVFYKNFGDYTSYVTSLTFEDIGFVGNGLSAEYIKSVAKNYGASYVVFCSKQESGTWVCFTKDIFFCLDDYADRLPTGQTHYLVVKAIGEGGEDLDGDGVIYADSEYGGDVNGEPLVYTIEETLPTTVQTKTYSNAGFISASTGAVTNPSSTWVHSDFIPVSALVDGEDGKCVKRFIGHGTVAAVAFYSTKGDFTSYTEGYILSNTTAKTESQSVAQVKANITNESSRYVVFSTDASKATLEVTGYI